ncbi:dienelactone hydrolase family protein [Ktedonospora formicarum]|uniref:Dienelactone hydrolase domain-containing protein n=1 Tax=Ktedonospora formicarum TaxID=2778364 RepID=A0A8J3I4L9_9CHLR|nr:dienelactone hydrolase family protein [Ktedonospora formicarum]GHO49394.1 hypothetical protein KSX_75570 [Ktedonospora formicarum]
MCYDDNARPPIPDGSLGNAYGEDLVLTSADGNRFMAYLARPEQTSDRQVLIYPDIRGLHQFYKDLALRFAELGIAALAIDYFGRTAGLTSREESVFEFRPHVQQLQLETFFQDVEASLSYLRQNVGAQGSIFTVGFCLGGSFSLLSGTKPDLGLKGIIAFYAGLSRSFGDGPSVLDQAKNITYPLLGLFGGADAGIPVSDVRKLEEALKLKGIDEKIVVYQGAPHSFFDRRSTDFAEASSDAWKQVQDFISTHS